VADRQPRRHGAQAVGRETGAATPKSGIAAGDGAKGSGGLAGGRGWEWCGRAQHRSPVAEERKGCPADGVLSQEIERIRELGTE
jgi:hypothetical protein